jgi:hypothetical protein
MKIIKNVNNNVQIYMRKVRKKKSNYFTRTIQVTNDEKVFHFYKINVNFVTEFVPISCTNYRQLRKGAQQTNKIIYKAKHSSDLLPRPFGLPRA